MTATATAYCTSSPIVYLQVVTRKSPTPSIFCLTTLPSSSSSSPNILSLDSSPLKRKQHTDNEDENIRPTRAIVLRKSATHKHQQDRSNNETDIEKILLGVGLRRKTIQRIPPPRQNLRSLTKRLAVPVCLLPLKTNIDRIRQALAIVLPYLKFLSITHDLESFCLTNATIFNESLPSRYGTQMRSVSTTTTRTTTTLIKRKTKRHLTSKTGKYTLLSDIHIFPIKRKRKTMSIKCLFVYAANHSDTDEVKQKHESFTTSRMR